MKALHRVLVCAALLPSVQACYLYNDQDAPALQIIANAVPKNEGAEGCTLVDAEKIYSEGVIDLALLDEYYFNMYIRNMLPQTTQFTGNGPKELRPEYNTVNLEYVEVIPDYQPQSKSPWAQKNGNLPLPTTWNVPVSRLLYPDGEDKAPMRVPVVPARITIGTKVTDVGRDWRARWGTFTEKYASKTRITLKLIAHGHTQAQHAVVSEPFIYPLTVCWGCLLYQPAFTGTADADPDYWRSCSTGLWPNDVKQPCVPGNNDYVPCGMYCFLCKNEKFIGNKFLDCDSKFCPPLQ